jgi:hypothetical protein
MCLRIRELLCYFAMAAANDDDTIELIFSQVYCSVAGEWVFS